MTAASVRKWDTTAANNDDADPAINYLEGQTPGSLNGSGRGVMDGVKRIVDDMSGAIITTGSANAYVATSESVVTALANGVSLRFRANFTNTGAATFAVDGLTATSIKTLAAAALTAGMIVSGGIYDIAYSSTASAWLLLNPSIGGGSVANFSAHKNGSDQTISSASPVKVTFGTERYDVGAYFASSTWTPPAGTVTMTARAYITGALDTDYYKLLIYKNGAEVAISKMTPSIISGEHSVESTITITIQDNPNGSDTYDIYVDSGSDTSYIVDGTATLTSFYGSLI